MMRRVEALREAVSPGGLLYGLTVCGGLIAGLFVATIALPGRKVAGQILSDGSRLVYRLNGLSLFVATHMFVYLGTRVFGMSLTPVLEQFWSVFAAANLLTVAWLVMMVRAGRRREKLSGSLGWSHWWYGIELNPQFFHVDLKVFAYQPSLLGLGLLNLAFAYAQYDKLGYLTAEMWMYQGFWWAYLFSHYLHEPGVLSMWDVIAEKFGFMLLWGDLVLVPFFYSIGGWYLVDAKASLPVPFRLALIAFFILGLWIFRGANAQKNAFKADRNAIIWGQPAKAVGGKLLVSGWWGMGRKINYTGEIMVYVSFAACTGFQSVIPYLLPLWLCCLLPHRAWRDEQRCKQKYGDLWTEYVNIAKFRMIPFIY